MNPLASLVGRDQFAAWLNDNDIRGTGVEVGTYYGQFAKHLASQWRGRLVTVDPYDWNKNPEYIDGCTKDWTAGVDLDPEVVRKEAETLLAGLENCRMVRERSLSAATAFGDGKLAFVYLDGDHSLESMASELPVWYAKVRPGGVFAGHDFYDRDCAAQQCGVATAVWDFSTKIGIRPHVTHCTSWWFIKP